MDLVRCLHFADLHLGVEAGGRPNPQTGLNQRIHDVCDRLDEVCACVEDEEVGVVIFAGDAFKHQQPTPTIQKLFAERIRRMARAGARVLLLVGNHDLPKMSALSHPFSIYDALEVEGVVVGDRARVYDLGPLQVAALPHFSRQQVLASLPPDDGDPDERIQQAVTQRVRALGREIDPDRPAIFAGHCHIHQAKIGAAQELFGLNDLEVSLSTLVSGQPFAYYAMGHVHHRQVLSTDPFVAYSGSLERVDYGEGERISVSPNGRVTRKPAEAKGFYRFDLHRTAEGWALAGEPSFREVAARGFVTVDLGPLRPEDPASDLAARLSKAQIEATGANVKVVAQVEAADRHRVSHKTAAEVLTGAYDVRLHCEVSAETAGSHDPRFAEALTPSQALDRYLETRDDWAADLENLRAAGHELIAEVLR